MRLWAAGRALGQRIFSLFVFVYIISSSCTSILLFVGGCIGIDASALFLQRLYSIYVYTSRWMR